MCDVVVLKTEKRKKCQKTWLDIQNTYFLWSSPCQFLATDLKTLISYASFGHPRFFCWHRLLNLQLEWMCLDNSTYSKCTKLIVHVMDVCILTQKIIRWNVINWCRFSKFWYPFNHKKQWKFSTKTNLLDWHTSRW